MQQDLSKKLKQIQSELTENNLTLKRFSELRLEARKAFDQKFTQMLDGKEYLPKIELPKIYFKIWKRKGNWIKVPISFRYIMSMPFIYGMMIPSLIFHASIEVYHQVCFRLYGIPLVYGKDYFVYDRQLLSQLNIFERINCIYCSYVNNLIRYSAEIGGRTERYWCPIKYHHRISNQHSQYDKFVSCSDPKKFRSEWAELRDFSDLEAKK